MYIPIMRGSGEIEAGYNLDMSPVQAAKRGDVLMLMLHCIPNGDDCSVHLLRPGSMTNEQTITVAILIKRESGVRTCSLIADM